MIHVELVKIPRSIFRSFLVFLHRRIIIFINAWGIYHENETKFRIESEQYRCHNSHPTVYFGGISFSLNLNGCRSFERMHFSTCSFSFRTVLSFAFIPKQICLVRLKIQSKINLELKVRAHPSQSRKCTQVMEHFNDEIIRKVR